MPAGRWFKVRTQLQLAAAREIFGDPEQQRVATHLLGTSLVDAAIGMFTQPWVRGALTPKERTLILLSLDASASQLEPSRLPQRIADARAEGATDREIVKVLQLTSLMACHSMSVGGTILYDVLVDRGEANAGGSLSPEQVEAIRHYEEDGPEPRTMSERLRTIMMTDTTHFSNMQTYINEAYGDTDVISPRLAHLICIAFDAAPTHLFETGLRIHINAALEHGATPSEINEAFQLASLRGWRTMLAGVAALQA